VLRDRRSRFRFSIESEFFHLLNTFGRTIALGSTQSLTERNFRDLAGG
jgi:hypothetical protein